MKEIKNIKSVLYMYIYKICILSLKCLHVLAYNFICKSYKRVFYFQIILYVAWDFRNKMIS